MRGHGLCLCPRCLHTRGEIDQNTEQLSVKQKSHNRNGSNRESERSTVTVVLSAQAWGGVQHSRYLGKVLPCQRLVKKVLHLCQLNPSEH